MFDEIGGINSKISIFLKFPSCGIIRLQIFNINLEVFTTKWLNVFFLNQLSTRPTLACNLI